MDILKPQLLWIGKRCYRVNSVANDDSSEQQQPATNEYIEDDLYAEEEGDAQDEFEVVEVSPNRYRTKFHVPQAFYGAIIGTKGAVKKRIEGETQTEIVIPKPRVTDDIKITGTKRNSVCLARRRIELIVLNCRQKQRPTHFTCVRILDPMIKHNFIQFKNEILQSGPTFGLEEQMFTEPERLHFTIGVMCLMDDLDRSKAVQLLSDCRETIVIPIKNQHKQIDICVRGVDIMNDDPSSVRYLYGKVNSNALQQIADGILKRFIDAGLAKREFDRDSVKLHMTLINATSAAADETDELVTKQIRAKRFDARHILDKFADYEFGSMELNEINLAIMQSKDIDGFYRCSATIKF